MSCVKIEKNYHTRFEREGTYRELEKANNHEKGRFGDRQQRVMYFRGDEDMGLPDIGNSDF